MRISAEDQHVSISGYITSTQFSNTHLWPKSRAQETSPHLSQQSSRHPSQSHPAVTKRSIQKTPLDQNLSNMDQVMQFVEPSRQFVKDSIRLVKRCTKPDRKEFSKIAMATAIGFAIMGFIGFFVKLIHIPINNIIVGG
ncbi:hypothetical protein J4Q44_G00187710 [Coregonus suidteri]|uniref:Protein transport protein Sec61 subunit gamma n=1 Tax=Coregonus suidteri TaxID=861788 RepID=A0AAN8QTL6_9TELE